MNRLDASFLLQLVFLALATGFGTSLVDPETHGLAIVFGLLTVLVGAIIGGKCLRPFGEDDNTKEVLQELAGHLRITGERNPSSTPTGERVGIGSIYLSTEKGSLWRKVLDALGDEPDPTIEIVRQKVTPG